MNEAVPVTQRLAAVAAVLACLGYGALAIGSGLDRMTRTQPELAALVPANFASQALRSDGAVQVAKGAFPAALVRGEATVVDAPLDPGSTALLGMARFRLGDAPGADRAFRIAGQLGWRDSLTQSYWMGRALEAGDWRIAAMRLDALLRQRPALLAERRLLDPLETSAAGRAAMAERMRVGPNWLGAYLTSLDEIQRPVLILRAQVLGELAARKGVLGCEAIGPLVERLAAVAAELEASTLWQQHCPGANRTLVYDGEFAAATVHQYRSRFAWVFQGHADTDIALEPAGKSGARRLVVDTAATRPKLVAQQMLLVPPGNYWLTWRAEDSNGRPSGLLAAALSCQRDPREWLAARLDPASERWQAAVEVGTACKTQWLNFAVGGRAGTVRLGEIALKRVR